MAILRPIRHFKRLRKGRGIASVISLPLKVVEQILGWGKTGHSLYTQRQSIILNT